MSERTGIPPFPPFPPSSISQDWRCEVTAQTLPKATPWSPTATGPQPSILTSDTQAHIRRGTASWHIRPFIFGPLSLSFRYAQVDLALEGADMISLVLLWERVCQVCVSVCVFVGAGLKKKKKILVSASCIWGLYQVRLLWQVYAGVCVCVCAHVCVSLFGVCGCQRYTCSFMSGPSAGPLGRSAKAVRRGGGGRRRQGEKKLPLQQVLPKTDTALISLWLLCKFYLCIWDIAKPVKRRRFYLYFPHYKSIPPKTRGDHLLINQQWVITLTIYPSWKHTNRPSVWQRKWQWLLGSCHCLSLSAYIGLTPKSQETCESGRRFMKNI